MPKKTINEIRAELDALNAKMAEKKHISDVQIISAVEIANRPHVRKKFTQSNKGKTTSDDIKQKISEKNKGNIPYNKGMCMSQEYKNKFKGKKASLETKTKMSKSKIGIKRPQIKCPHCNKIGSDNTMPRWHFDNCKQK